MLRPEVAGEKRSRNETSRSSHKKQSKCPKQHTRPTFQQKVPCRQDQGQRPNAKNIPPKNQSNSPKCCSTKCRQPTHLQKTTRTLRDTSPIPRNGVAKIQWTTKPSYKQKQLPTRTLFLYKTRHPNRNTTTTMLHLSKRKTNPNPSQRPSPIRP